MSSNPSNAPRDRLPALFGGGTVVGMHEEQLRQRFRERRDEVSFEALVSLHGAMVLGVCRRVLKNGHDAEDAFQATFLVLALRLDSLQDRERLGPWLHAVACRVARRARSQTVRRHLREQPGSERIGIAAKATEELQELRAVLDEELTRLPEKLRSPIVLCDLEGLTHEEAAAQLRWPLGTVKSRLAGARECLRGRLTRRGLAPTVGVAAVLGSKEAAAAVPMPLLDTTVRTATRAAAGKSTAGVVSVTIAKLVDGVLLTMFISRSFKMAIPLVMTAALLVAWSGRSTHAGADQPPTAGAASEPGADGEKAKPAGSQEVDVAPAMLKVETDLEILQLNVGIMKEELAKSYAQLVEFRTREGDESRVSFLERRLNNAFGIAVQGRGMRPAAEEVSLAEAEKQFSSNRERYLEQRRRLRREVMRLEQLRSTSADLPGRLDDPIETPKGRLSSLEIGDAIEAAEVDRLVKEWESDALRTRLGRSIRVLRAVEFRGGAKHLANSGFNPIAMGKAREAYEANLEASFTKVQKEAGDTEKRYLESKQVLLAANGNLDRIRRDYQQARIREQPQRIVRPGDTLTLEFDTETGRWVQFLDMAPDGNVMLSPYFASRGNLNVPVGLPTLKAAGLTGTELTKAYIEALRSEKVTFLAPIDTLVIWAQTPSDRLFRKELIQKEQSAKSPGRVRQSTARIVEALKALKGDDN